LKSSEEVVGNWAGEDGEETERTTDSPSSFFFNECFNQHLPVTSELSFTTAAD